MNTKEHIYHLVIYRPSSENWIWESCTSKEAALQLSIKQPEDDPDLILRVYASKRRIEGWQPANHFPTGFWVK